MLEMAKEKIDDIRETRQPILGFREPLLPR